MATSVHGSPRTLASLRELHTNTCGSPRRLRDAGLSQCALRSRLDRHREGCASDHPYRSVHLWALDREGYIQQTARKGCCRLGSNIDAHAEPVRIARIKPPHARGQNPAAKELPDRECAQRCCFMLTLPARPAPTI